MNPTSDEHQTRSAPAPGGGPADEPTDSTKASLEAGEHVSLTLLRVGAGTILTVHGAMKLANVAATTESFAALGIPLPEVAVYCAIAGELLGGLGLLVGLLTRLAALGPICAMAAAIGFAHAGNGLLARNDGWEYPLTLLLVSLFFLFRGPGPISLDALIARLRSPKPLPRQEGHPISRGLGAEALHRSM